MRTPRYSDEDEDDLDDFIINDDGLAKDDPKSASQDSLSSKSLRLPSTQTSRPSFAERRTARPNVDQPPLPPPSIILNIDQQLHQFFVIPNSRSTPPPPPTPRRPHSKPPPSSAAPPPTPHPYQHPQTNISATGVTTSRTERGHVSEEKAIHPQGHRWEANRSAVNYRPTVKEERMSARAGVQKKVKLGGKGKGGFLGGGFLGGGFLGGLFRGDSWG